MMMYVRFPLSLRNVEDLLTDPIGYEDQVNLYAYVGNDPVNLIDPTGLDCTSYSEGGVIIDTNVADCGEDSDGAEEEIVVNGPSRKPRRRRSSGTTTGPIASSVASAAQDGEESRDEGEMSENSNDQTDGWQCFKDVAWGAIQSTVIGTVVAGIAEASANPEKRFSGDNANGRRLPRGTSGTARAIAKGVGKAGLIGLVIGGGIGGVIAYSESEHCPAIF